MGQDGLCKVTRAKAPDIKAGNESLGVEKPPATLLSKGLLCQKDSVFVETDRNSVIRREVDLNP